MVPYMDGQQQQHQQQVQMPTPVAPIPARVHSDRVSAQPAWVTTSTHQDVPLQLEDPMRLTLVDLATRHQMDRYLLAQQYSARYFNGAHATSSEGGRYSQPRSY
jgi:hypothetical protein